MVKTLIKALKGDKDYYYMWQSNIAMMFYDEYRRDKKQYKSFNDIHRIANQAAKNFLDLLKK